jgi:cholesterol oxidase
MAFVPVRRWFSRRVGLTTCQDPVNPNPTFIPEGSAATTWLARHTGGIAQSMATEALLNIPTTAHILGGAVIGRDANSGVVDRFGRAFGYRNLIICDGSVVPANPGVNPSLTITALAEYIIAAVPAKSLDGAAPMAPLLRNAV